MATVPQLEAELAGEERAIRHLVGERAALNSRIAREEARAKLLEAQIRTTRNHPDVGHRDGPPGGPIPAGDRFYDVSSYQPHADLAAARHAASVRVGRLGITKLSEGAGWVDQYGGQRLRQMAGLGYPHRGAYHFLHPSINPVEQAHHFLAAAESHGVVWRPSDFVICDCEVSDGQPAAVVRACTAQFGAELAKHVPSQRWLYGGGPFLHELGVTLSGFHAHWLAAFVANPAPYMVFGRARTVAWQYTDGRYGPTPHVCPGVGVCDMSIVL